MNGQQTFAFTVGMIFAIVGALGFIPVLTPNDMLLGIFMVMGLHSIVHVAVGVLGIALAFTGLARFYNLLIGVVYLVLSVLGFIPAMVPNHMLLGLLHINLADNLLHLLVGIAALAIGIFLKTAGAANGAQGGVGAWSVAQQRPGTGQRW